MDGKVLIVTQCIDCSVAQEAGLVDWAMVHNLKERLVFFCDVGVENAHQAINSTTKEMIGPPVKELEGCNVVVVFCIHPSFLVLAAIPDICQAIYKMVRRFRCGHGLQLTATLTTHSLWPVDVTALYQRQHHSHCRPRRSPDGLCLISHLSRGLAVIVVVSPT